VDEVRDALLSLSTKKTSVGLDAVSNDMLKHLPANFIFLLHKLFNKCWIEGVVPVDWKQSIVIPIHKQGKPRTDKTSYRPIALTSHTGKLMERIILKRLMYFCDKNKIIPVNQAGFRKDRSAIDNLVKLSTHVKIQFARRKNVLATFFDIKRAYDQVWHAKLLHKLKNLGFSGHFYNYIKSFLTNRSIQVRVAKSYSSFRSLHMGLPQGSVISPLLFNVLLYDLPMKLSKEVVLVQYADDICMWMNVSMKRNTPKRALKYIKKVYQNQLNNIDNYMLENGFTLSTEKTYTVLFNNGSNPDDLPAFRIGTNMIEYKDTVKFLGVILTSKLTWNAHIEDNLTKAKKGLNFLKMLSKQFWGQDTLNMKYLATSLIRSKLSYGQEVFFQCA